MARKCIVTALAKDGKVFWGYENPMTKKKLAEVEKFMRENEGGEVVIIFERYFQKKYMSDKQRNYYFACVVKVAGDYFGYEPDEMHSVFGDMFLRKPVDGKSGVLKAEITRSITGLTTVEFMNFVQDCRDFCKHEYKLETEDPDPDYWKASFTKKKK